MKTPDQVRNICIAAIKRSIIPPFDFKYSNIYEELNVINKDKMGIDFKLENHELPICSTIINEKVWTILTTDRIISLDGVELQQHKLNSLKKWNFGDFKGYSSQIYTKGFLHFKSDIFIPVFVETGRASMVMIYGIMTIYKIR